MDSASAELGAIADAIEELQSRLAQAYDQNEAATLTTGEVDIRQLFVEAQRFAEASLSKLEEQIQELLMEAEAKAVEILREATEEAEEIRRQAYQSSVVPDQRTQELRAAIVTFASVNSELVTELTALSELLTASAPRQGPMNRASGAWRTNR